MGERGGKRWNCGRLRCNIIITTRGLIASVMQLVKLACYFIGLLVAPNPTPQRFSYILTTGHVIRSYICLPSPHSIQPPHICSPSALFLASFYLTVRMGDVEREFKSRQHIQQIFTFTRFQMLPYEPSNGLSNDSSHCYTSYSVPSELMDGVEIQTSLSLSLKVHS